MNFLFAYGRLSQLCVLFFQMFTASSALILINPLGFLGVSIICECCGDMVQHDGCESLLTYTTNDNDVEFSEGTASAWRNLLPVFCLILLKVQQVVIYINLPVITLHKSVFLDD